MNPKPLYSDDHLLLEPSEEADEVLEKQNDSHELRPIVADDSDVDEAQTQAVAPSDSSSDDTANTQEEAEAIEGPDSESQAQADQFKEAISTIIAPYGTNVSVSYRDIASGSLFDLNGDTIHTSASMIKLLILAEAFDQVNSGWVSLDDMLYVDWSQVVGGTGSLQYYGGGTSQTLRELLRLMIAESDNTATNVLIDYFGMEAINEEAATLELWDAQLRRHMMDFDAQAMGLENTMSTRDAAYLLGLIARDQFYSPELSQEARSYLEQQTDNAGIVWGLPQDVIFAHKTGTLSLVQHDGGIREGESPYVLVVFTEGLDQGSAWNLMSEIASTIEAGRTS